MLPGELRPHPSPFQYVMIAVVLCVITAIEVGIYYLEGDIPTALLRRDAAGAGADEVRHGRRASTCTCSSDRPIFQRFFITGAIGAVVLYTIVLTTLHVFE